MTFDATFYFLVLVGVFVGLCAIAIIKPKLSHPLDITQMKKMLGELLPHHDLIIKHEPTRLVVSLDGIQKAIVIMDRPKADYVMGGLPIFTTNQKRHIKAIAQKITSIQTIH